MCHFNSFVSQSNNSASWRILRFRWQYQPELYVPAVAVTTIDTTTAPSAMFFFFHTSTFQPLDKPWSQVSFLPPLPRFLASIFIAHRVQQSHCSSIFHRVLLSHALALSASQIEQVRKKKSPRIYSSMHSGGFDLTKLTYTRLEDNLIRHRGDRQVHGRVSMSIRVEDQAR